MGRGKRHAKERRARAAELADPAPRLRELYDRAAGDYQVVNTAYDPALLPLIEAFTARLSPGAQVLDVGCGAGRDAAYLSERGFAVVGVDLSPAMLALARKVAPAANFLEMDMRALDFPNSSFEALWASAAFLHLPKADAPKTLADFRRVLRAGSPVSLTVKGGTGEGWEPAPYGEERFFARYDDKELERLFTEAGFAEVAIVANEARGDQWLTATARAL